MKETAKLLVSCPDRRGLVARISDFVFRNGGNFLHFDQHTDIQAGVFLARAEWELNGFQIPRERIGELSVAKSLSSDSYSKESKNCRQVEVLKKPGHVYLHRSIRHRSVQARKVLNPRRDFFTQPAASRIDDVSHLCVGMKPKGLTGPGLEETGRIVGESFSRESWIRST